jgi:hypothetical protein
MTNFELLTGLDWPAAFAIVGSVVALVGGMLAVYVNYLQAKPDVRLVSQLPTPENIQIHDRISGIRNRLAIIEGDQRVIKTEIENIRKGMLSHEQRDQEDFKTLNTKNDRLMEIIVEMLKDDH